MEGLWDIPSHCIPPLHTHFHQSWGRLRQASHRHVLSCWCREGSAPWAAGARALHVPRVQLWGGDTQRPPIHCPQQSSVWVCPGPMRGGLGQGDGAGDLMWVVSLVPPAPVGMQRGVCAAMEPSFHMCACVLGLIHAEHQCVGLPSTLGLGLSHIFHPPHGLAGCSTPHSCTLHLWVCCAWGMQGTRAQSGSGTT